MFEGTGARGAGFDWFEVPTTRPGPVKASGSLFEEREHMLPMLMPVRGIGDVSKGGSAQ